MKGPSMIDTPAEKGVEIQVSPNVAGLGTNVWVNVDGVCRLRVLTHPDAIIAIDDCRTEMIRLQLVAPGGVIISDLQNKEGK